ncbi:dihydrofolate reductase [Candidatus Uhrbacteria bacterium]|nr:dihydrofolate reductase [Candidatus Uhrbacteria bacterium]
MKVMLLMAQTVDGKIARARDELIDWTSKEDKKFFVAETKRVGVVVMGSRTFMTFGRPLPGRHIIVMTRQEPAPALVREETEKEGVVPGTVEFTNDPPQKIIERLSAHGREEVIVAGGPTTNNLFLEAGLIDEIKLSIEPKLFGSGLSVFEGSTLNQELELLSVTNLTPHVIVVHYKIRKA